MLYALLGGFAKALQDQPVKDLPGLWKEHPSQMNQAGGADADAPAVARKPGEIAAGRTNRSAPRSSPETPDFKYDSMGVGKGVRVPALNTHAVGRPGDGVQAVPAKDEGLLVR